jgi:hypothetical protein
MVTNRLFEKQDAFVKAVCFRRTENNSMAPAGILHVLFGMTAITNELLVIFSGEIE